MLNLEEIKSYLRIDGDFEDDQLVELQKSSEKYLENSGIRADYTNSLYKLAICMMINHFYENRLFESTGNHVARFDLSLNSLINTLRYNQEEI